MQAKTIKSVIRRKVDAWAKSIEDDEIRNLVLNDTIVTGGSIASMLLSEKVNDFDVYFRTGSTAFRVAKYYIKKFAATGKSGHEMYLANNDGHKIESFEGNEFKVVVKSAGVASESDEETAYEYFELDDPDGEKSEEFIAKVNEIAKDKASKPPYRPVFLSSNAITLSDDVQVVTRFFGEPDQIHDTYDFVHCMCYWSSWDNNLVLRPESLESLLSKTLVYRGSRYPICSVIRTRKFIQRGWRVTAGQYLKMCMQISELDLTDIKVLRDQLVGVDSAYFLELIGMLTRKMEESGQKSIDMSYVAQLIDSM